MGHGRHVTGSSQEAAPVAVADCNVTGTITPNATCNYYYAGIYLFWPYYKRRDGAYFHWQASVNVFYISGALGNITIPHWRRVGAGKEGNYSPFNGAVGVATVSAGSH